MTYRGGFPPTPRSTVEPSDWFTVFVTGRHRFDIQGTDTGRQWRLRWRSLPHYFGQRGSVRSRRPITVTWVTLRTALGVYCQHASLPGHLPSLVVSRVKCDPSTSDFARSPDSGPTPFTWPRPVREVSVSASRPAVRPTRARVALFKELVRRWSTSARVLVVHGPENGRALDGRPPTVAGRPLEAGP